MENAKKQSIKRGGRSLIIVPMRNIAPTATENWQKIFASERKELEFFEPHVIDSNTTHWSGRNSQDTLLDGEVSAKGSSI